MSSTGIYWAAAGAVVILLGLTELVARVASGRKTGFISTVVLGTDGRTSTSKTFIFLWTLLVAWALASLLIAGELLHEHTCAAATKDAIAGCKKVSDEVGLLQLGWGHFLHQGLIGSYLVLLGIPGTAGIAAKAITQTNATAAPGSKTPAKAAKGVRGLAGRAAEIFSADDGTTDIGDFQYMIFNLITAVYFVSKFVNPVGKGLPAIPDTLLGLTSVSAAVYVGKKAVTRNEPKVTSVFPATLREGDAFTISGVGLYEAGDAANLPLVTINGIHARPVTVDPQIADRLTAVVPAGLIAPAAEKPEIEAQLQVYTAFGATTPEFKVRCSR